jgi:hypothetical protein
VRIERERCVSETHTLRFVELRVPMVCSVDRQQWQRVEKKPKITNCLVVVVVVVVVQIVVVQVVVQVVVVVWKSVVELIET